LISLDVSIGNVQEVAPMTESKFDKLVSKGIIRKPDSLSEDDKQRINSLTPDEVEALISVRAKLGDEFLGKKATGASPSIAIVF
jgi:hypothetical protein